MPKAFEFCLPTKGTNVPAGPEWLPEIKHDGYRMRVERDGDRVRDERLISADTELAQSARLERPLSRACCFSQMTMVVDPIFLERQMSKRKSTTASKAARRPKMAARAQRNKQEVVRSRKDSFLRSVAAVSIEPPLKLQDDPRQDAPVVESGVGALQDDLSDKMRDSNQTKGFALATANTPVYQAKLLEIAQANLQFAYEFGLRLATIKSPVEFFAVITEFTTRRIDMFGRHSKEMAAYPFWRTGRPERSRLCANHDGKPCSRSRWTRGGLRSGHRRLLAFAAASGLTASERGSASVIGV